MFVAKVRMVCMRIACTEYSDVVVHQFILVM